MAHFACSHDFVVAAHPSCASTTKHLKSHYRITDCDCTHLTQTQEAATTEALGNMQLQVRVQSSIGLPACPESRWLVAFPHKHASRRKQTSAHLDIFDAVRHCADTLDRDFLHNISSEMSHERKPLHISQSPPPLPLPPDRNKTSVTALLTSAPNLLRAAHVLRATAQLTNAEAAAWMMWSSSVRCGPPSAAPRGVH